MYNMSSELSFEERMFRVYIPAPAVDKKDLVKKLWKKVKFSKKYPPEIIISILSQIGRDKCVYEIARIVGEQLEKEKGLTITPDDVSNIIETVWKAGFLRAITLKDPNEVFKVRAEKRFIAAPTAPPTKLIKLPEVAPAPVPEEILKTAMEVEVARETLTVDEVARNILHALLDRCPNILWSILVRIPVNPISLVTQEGIKITSETNVAAIVNTLWHTAASYVQREPLATSIGYCLIKGDCGFMIIKGFKIKKEEFVLAVATDAEAGRRLSVVMRDLNWAIRELIRDLNRLLK